MVIAVSDTGIGIAAESLPEVFEMFTQVAHGVDRSKGGLGIGLALVRHLVQLHGGSVGAASAGIGEGSTFTVRLPLGRAASPEAPPAAPHRRPGRHASCACWWRTTMSTPPTPCARCCAWPDT